MEGQERLPGMPEKSRSIENPAACMPFLRAAYAEF
jgi:hypothetical protein